MQNHKTPRVRYGTVRYGTVRLSSAFLIFLGLSTLLTSCPTDGSKPSAAFDVRFDANGGGGTPPAMMTWTGGAGLLLPGAETLTTPAADKDFAGWSETESGARTASPYLPTQNVTLYARWRPFVTITFDAGVVDASVSSIKSFDNEAVNLPHQVGATRSDGFVFGGWALESSNGTTVSSPYAPTAPLGGAVTLYARWLNAEDVSTEALERLACIKRVVGNPADNPPEMQTALEVQNALNTLLEGEDAERIMHTGDVDITEHYKIYNYDAIYAKSVELEELMAEFTGSEVLIVDSMFFQYTGTVQSASLWTSGVYEIELAGAAGGHIWTTSNATNWGGRGGHVKAEYDFTGNTNVEIRIGGQGQGTAGYEGGQYRQLSYVYNQQRLGGYNGGGNGGAAYYNQSYRPGSGGGGATDVRLSGSTSTLNGQSGTDPRIIVAGGGGGSAQTAGQGNQALVGGDAGGTEGSPGNSLTSSIPQGGTQTNGGTQTSSYSHAGSPGNGKEGMNGNSAAYEGRGGGGGGWWGGGANGASSGSATASGAGGSSYTGGTSSITLNTALLSPVNETIQGNTWGDGWAKITWKR